MLFIQIFSLHHSNRNNELPDRIQEYNQNCGHSTPNCENSTTKLWEFYNQTVGILHQTVGILQPNCGNSTTKLWAFYTKLWAFLPLVTSAP